MCVYLCMCVSVCVYVCVWRGGEGWMCVCARACVYVCKCSSVPTYIGAFVFVYKTITEWDKPNCNRFSHLRVT